MSASSRIVGRPLPDELPDRGAVRGMLVSLLLALLLFAALNAVLARMAARGGQSFLKQAWNRLDATTGPVDWLALGDSFCLHDVMPSVLSERLGGEALNCGSLANMTLLNVAWMIGDRYARQQPPRQVVIVMAFSTWETAPDRWTRQGLAAIPRPLAELEQLAPTLPLSPLQRLEFFADRYLKLYSSHDTIAAALQGRIYQRLAGQPFKRWTRPGESAAGALADQVAVGAGEVSPADLAAGYAPLKPLTPAQQEELIQRAGEAIAGRACPIAAENEAALRVIGELAATHGFDVWLANGPVVRELNEMPASAQYLRTLDEQLARLTAGQPRLRYIPGYCLVERGEAMDMGHLLPVGARRYTAWLADIIARTTAAGS